MDELANLGNQSSSLLGSLSLDEPEVTETTDVNPGFTARLAALNDTDVTQPNIIGQLEALTEEYTSLIDAVGERSVRQQAATQQVADQLQATRELYTEARKMSADDGSLEAIVASAQSTLDADIADREKYALEQRAIERVQDMASRDPVQAELLFNNLYYGGADDVIRDMNTKYLILDREIRRAQVEQDAQGWLFDAANFTLSMLPLNFSLSRNDNVEIPQMMKSWYDNLFPGQRLQREGAVLMDMPVSMFSDYVKDTLIPNLNENATLFGYKDQSEYLNLLTELKASPHAGYTNLWAGIDNIGLIPAAATTKLVSIPSLLIRTGARKEAAETIAKAAAEMATDGVEAAVKRNGVDLDDVVNNITPTAVKTGPATSTVPLSADVVSNLDRAQALMEKFPEVLTSSRFADDTEFRNAVEKTIERLEVEVGRELKDVRVNGLTPDQVTLETGTQLADKSRVHGIEMTLGQKKGGGFAKENTAANFARSLGYPDAEIIRDQSGQFFVKIQRDMPETGFYTNLLNPRSDTVFGRFLKGARLVSDPYLADLAQAAGNKRSRVIKEVLEPYEATFRTLSRPEKEAVTQVLAVGNNQAKWFTEDEFEVLIRRGYNRAPTKKEYDAYNAYREINDIEWALRNDDKYKGLLVKGYETVSIQNPLVEIPEMNALIDRRFTKIPANGRVYNLSDNVHYHKGNPIDATKLREDGYYLVNLEHGVKMKDGTTVRTFAVKPNDLNTKPLRRDQIPYRAGGHRMYADKYFVKQASQGVQPDTGEKFFNNPSTFITGTRKETQAWAERMESARRLVKAAEEAGEEVSARAIDEIFGGARGYPTGEEFLKGIEDGTFDKDNPFMALYDRELPPTSGASYLGDVDEAGFDQWLNTTGRMYYSRRGDALKNWQGDLAPTLDPFETINKALMNIANVTSFSDYKVSAIERWVKTFKDYTNAADLREASDLTIFQDAVLKRGIPENIRQGAMAQRDIIRRTLSWKSDSDLAGEQLTRRMSEFVFQAEPGTKLANAERVVANWWDTNNPVQALRSAAFDMKLGLFNLAQLPLQASTMAATISLSPKHGLSAMTTLMPLRVYLTKSGTEHMLNTLVERNVHGMSGFKTAAEFKEFMRAGKQSGFFNFNVNHQLINAYGPNAAVGEFGNNLSKVRNAGRFFFNEPELWNRGVAWHVGWKETRELFPNLSTKNPEFLRRVQGRAEEYSMSMSEQSSAWWQRGVMSVPTQFFSYQARMIEAMFGKTFTPAQKTRLIAVQTLMYGSAGLPFLPFITERIKGSQGDAPDIDTFLRYTGSRSSGPPDVRSRWSGR